MDQQKLDALAKARARAKEVREEKALLKKQEKELIKLEQKKKDDDIRKRYAELKALEEPEVKPEVKPEVVKPVPESESSSSSEEEQVIVKKKKKKPKKKKVKYVYESSSDSSSEEEEPRPRPVPRHKPSKVPPSSQPMSNMYTTQQPSIRDSEMYKKMFGM